MLVDHPIPKGYSGLVSTHPVDLDLVIRATESTKQNCGYSPSGNLT